MVISAQTETFVDLIFCAMILGIGLMYSKKSKKSLLKYVAVAFGLFGVSHLATILDVETQYANIFVFGRSFAYVMVIYALYAVYNNKESS